MDQLIQKKVNDTTQVDPNPLDEFLNFFNYLNPAWYFE